MIKGCLFDMDGVLLDTERMGVEVMRQEAARLGYTFTTELYCKILGVNHDLGRSIIKDALGQDFPYDEMMRGFLREFLRAAREGRLPTKPGLGRCLTGLKSRGLKLALATSTERAVVEEYIAHVPQMQNMFHAVVCGDEVAASKPAPDIYLRAAEKLGLGPEECIGIEDSRNGLLSLAAAGVPGVMIPDLLPFDESLAPVVRWKLDRLADLLPLVDGERG